MSCKRRLNSDILGGWCHRPLMPPKWTGMQTLSEYVGQRALPAWGRKIMNGMSVGVGSWGERLVVVVSWTRSRPNEAGSIVVAPGFRSRPGESHTGPVMGLGRSWEPCLVVRSGHGPRATCHGVISYLLGVDIWVIGDCVEI